MVTWLFGPVSARPLAILRVAFGAFACVYGCVTWRHFAFLTEVLARESAAGHDLAAIHWFGVVAQTQRSALSGTALANVLLILGAGALALGWWTRLAAVATWLSLQFLQTTLPLAQNGGDKLLAQTAFLLLIAALAGHAQADLSVDARRRDAGPMIPAWSVRLLQSQLVLVYLLAGAHKAATADWSRGEALGYVFREDFWTRLDVAWLGSQPALVALLTFGTLAFEAVIFPVFVWGRGTRPLVLLLGVLFHVAIGATLQIFVFCELMLLRYLIFIDAALLDDVKRRVRRWRAYAAPSPGLHWTARAGAAALLLHVVALVVTGLPDSPASMALKQPFFRYIYATNQWQHWIMFAQPSHQDYRLGLAATASNGQISYPWGEDDADWSPRAAHLVLGLFTHDRPTEAESLMDVLAEDLAAGAGRPTMMELSLTDRPLAVYPPPATGTAAGPAGAPRFYRRSW